MRNRYAGTCYRCGETVEPGAGHFERYQGRWRTQHANCAIKYRGTSKNAQDDAKKERTARMRTEAAR